MSARLACFALRDARFAKKPRSRIIARLGGMQYAPLFLTPIFGVWEEIHVRNYSHGQQTISR